jgi:hypothetical protein
MSSPGNPTISSHPVLFIIFFLQSLIQYLSVAHYPKISTFKKNMPDPWICKYITCIYWEQSETNARFLLWGAILFQGKPKMSSIYLKMLQPYHQPDRGIPGRCVIFAPPRSMKGPKNYLSAGPVGLWKARKETQQTNLPRMWHFDPAPTFVEYDIVYINTSSLFLFSILEKSHIKDNQHHDISYPAVVACRGYWKLFSTQRIYHGAGCL